MKLAYVSHLWIRRVGNPVAGAFAARIFRTMEPDDKSFAVAAT